MWVYEVGNDRKTRKFCNEELHNLCCLRDVIRVTKSSRNGWTCAMHEL